MRETRGQVELIFPAHSNNACQYYHQLAEALLHNQEAQANLVDSMGAQKKPPPAICIDMAKEAVSILHRALVLVGRRGAIARVEVRKKGALLHTTLPMHAYIHTCIYICLTPPPPSSFPLGG